MSQCFASFPVVKRFFFLFILLCATLPVSWKLAQAAIPDSQDILLQYSAAGHLLGFASDGLYVAGGDHLFHVGFVGASGIKPEAANSHRAEENPPLSGVDYHDLWPGIHLHYAVTQKGIAESTWEIIPGAHVNQIRLRYNAPVTIGIDGNLNIKYPTGTMNESAPVAWQEIDGHRCPVKVAFSLFASSAKASVLGFKVGQYDSSRPLLIDPTLSWNTFMGVASGYDTGNAIAVDSQGNIYVVGYGGPWGNTSSYAGGEDAFVAKFDSNGNLVWNTFLGSSQFDEANAVAVDSNGSVFVAGDSEASWGSPKQGYTGGRDGFVAKLNNSGVLQWNTFMGSSGDDIGTGIEVGSSGEIYVTGESKGSWGSNPKRPYTGDWDAFAAKLDANGTLTWNTFLGSTELDNGEDVTIDGNGAVYVTGYSTKSWGNNPVRGFTGTTYDAFAAKLNSSGVLQWNTFLGSSGVDVAEGIALDKTNNIYIIGGSAATWENPINNFTGGGDVFVAKLQNNGVLQWNTFLGSTGYDVGQAITLDNQGYIYVTGHSDAAWGNGKQAYAGGEDAFAAQLTGNGTFKWNTFLGSSDDDEGHGITAGNGGRVYITGISESTWGAPRNPHTDGGLNPDAFVAKLRPSCSFYVFRSKNGKTTAVCL